MKTKSMSRWERASSELPSALSGSKELMTWVGVTSTWTTVVSFEESSAAYARKGSEAAMVAAATIERCTIFKRMAPGGDYIAMGACDGVLGSLLGSFAPVVFCYVRFWCL